MNENLWKDWIEQFKRHSPVKQGLLTQIDWRFQIHMPNKASTDYSRQGQYA